MKETKIDPTQARSTPQPTAAPSSRGSEKAPSIDPSRDGGKAKPKKNSILIYGVIGIILFGGGVGAAAYQGWIPLPGWHQEKKPEPVNPKPTDLGPMIKLSPLTLNLKEREGGHYLKTTIVLEIGQKEWAPEVQGRISALTDLMIITLCDKSLEDLRRPEAKDHLKKELLAKANQSLDGQKIKQIYFDEFLFQ